MATAEAWPSRWCGGRFHEEIIYTILSVSEHDPTLPVLASVFSEKSVPAPEDWRPIHRRSLPRHDGQESVAMKAATGMV